jgi:hypothetical protein
MATYTFKNTITEEVIDIVLDMNDYEEFKNLNPHLERYFDIDSVPPVISGFNYNSKIDSGFKEVLSKVAEAHPESTLAQSHLSKSIKQSRTERAVKQWKKKNNTLQ